MVLESLIKDDQKVTFDCCKATITKGGMVEIPDIHYSHAEIRGAIKLGLVRLVGPEPAVVQSSMHLIKKIKLRNRSPHLLTFECVKGSVVSGACIDIPETLMNEREIQNALAWNMLEDAENPKPIAPAGDPISLDEITVGDVELATQAIPTSSAPQEHPRQTQTQRPMRAQPTRRQSAKPIGRAGDKEVELYSESVVRDHKPTKRRAAGTSAPIPIDADESTPSVPEISFDDIFEGQ
jgi:hypothetical protein